MSKLEKQIIKKNYNYNDILYKIFWSKKELHHGLWEENTKNLSEALVNTNKLVSKCLEIKENDIVLDVGCGFGGTCIYIAENFRANVIGINISDIQLKTAKQNAKKSLFPNLIKFFKQDFMKTKFENGTFTKIYGVESIVHANKKINFLKDAYRLLKPKGKIAILDLFLTRTGFNKKENEAYMQYSIKEAFSNLSTKEKFYKYLKKAGFRNIKFHDKSQEIKKSTKILYFYAVLGYPITWILSKTKIVPKSVHLHTISCLNENRLFEYNMCSYGIFVAEK